MFTIIVFVFEKSNGLLVRRTPGHKQVVYLDNQTVRPIVDDVLRITRGELDLNLRVDKVELVYDSSFHIRVNATEL